MDFWKEMSMQSKILGLMADAWMVYLTFGILFVAVVGIIANRKLKKDDERTKACALLLATSRIQNDLCSYMSSLIIPLEKSKCEFDAVEKVINFTNVSISNGLLQTKLYHGDDEKDLSIKLYVSEMIQSAFMQFRLANVPKEFAIHDIRAHHVINPDIRLKFQRAEIDFLGKYNISILEAFELLSDKLESLNKLMNDRNVKLEALQLNSQHNSNVSNNLSSFILQYNKELPISVRESFVAARMLMILLERDARYLTRGIARIEALYNMGELPQMNARLISKIPRGVLWRVKMWVLDWVW